MSEPVESAEELLGAVLRRFLRQNGREMDGVGEGVARRLAEVVRERGVFGGVTDEEIRALVARVLEGEDDAILADGVKQLVKTCFYPELAVCRDSFREVARDGACRRQELARARGRVSGTHCVDCPHWLGLAEGEHERMLASEWRSGAREFGVGREIFLPEDFRRLRQGLQRMKPAGRGEL